jgi:hypothetical protein
MRICDYVCVGVALGLLAGTASNVSAQTFENVGVRAQGMSGAFVAVADDATASWWNPAGLATGTYLSAVLERGRTTEPATPPAEGPAARTTSSTVALAFPALGISYYRLRVSEIAPPATTAVSSENRQDPRKSGTSVRSVAISQFGTTVGQSLGDHLVIGTTLKLLRAGAVVTAPSGTDLLDDADAASVARQTRADVDAGAMANFGHVRLGLTVKNVFEPSFGDEGTDRLTLGRQARVGLAVLSVANGSLEGVTVAADADLTTTATAVGEVRHVAAGAEAWLAKGRLGVRAGASANTVGASRPAASAGVSVAVTPAFHVNASKTMGRDESVTGWSSSVSVSF